MPRGRVGVKPFPPPTPPQHPRWRQPHHLTPSAKQRTQERMHRERTLQLSGRGDVTVFQRAAQVVRRIPHAQVTGWAGLHFAAAAAVREDRVVDRDFFRP